MTQWIIACDSKDYDIWGAFSEFQKIDWKQSTNIEPGDIVYIYMIGPYSAIQFQCLVKKTNLKEIEIDDLKYVKNGAKYASCGRYMELEFLQKYSTPLFTYKNLEENGLKQVRGPQRVKDELARYIAGVTNQLINEEEDNNLLQEVNGYIPDAAIIKKTYKGVKKEKVAPVIRNGQKIYTRDRQTAINALAHANYVCEIEPAHPTFLRKNTDKTYTEPHHLVPLSHLERFDVSLDVEENIVSLCSNCHNQMHYGKDAKSLIVKLYGDRKEHLKKVGIDITLDELLKMYL